VRVSKRRWKCDKIAVYKDYRELVQIDETIRAGSLETYLLVRDAGELIDGERGRI
jgi:hypothetical protein